MFSKFHKFPHRFATWNISETLKTCLKLNINFTRPHAITCTNTHYACSFQKQSRSWASHSSIPAGGPIGDYFFSTVPGLNFYMSMSTCRQCSKVTFIYLCWLCVYLLLLFIILFTYYLLTVELILG